MINTKVDFIPLIQDKVLEIGGLLNQIKEFPSFLPSVELRKQNKIKTVFSTVRIEGNELSVDEVTAIIKGNRVKGNKQQVLEVKNTISLYELLSELNPSSEMDFLLAHKILMKNLLKTNGSYRKKNVGIESKGKIKQIFPEAEDVSGLCKNLFEYILNSADNYIVKSCIIHYLIESIHPFEDGNGRMGRFWHSLYLSKHHEIFNYLPLESHIRKRQKEYYEGLYLSQKSDSPTLFVNMMLSVIIDALKESFSYSYEVIESKKERRFSSAKSYFGDNEFCRKDYLNLFKSLSSSTATKDLAMLVNEGKLSKIGNGSGSRYRFV